MRDLNFYNDFDDQLQEPNKTITLDMEREIVKR